MTTISGDASWLVRQTRRILVCAAGAGGVIGGAMVLDVPPSGLLPDRPELRYLIGLVGGAVASFIISAITIDTFANLVGKYSPSRAFRRESERVEINHKIARALFGWSPELICDGKLPLGIHVQRLMRDKSDTAERVTWHASFCEKCHQENLDHPWREHPIRPISFCTSADAMVHLIERLSELKAQIHIQSRQEDREPTTTFRCEIRSPITSIDSEHEYGACRPGITAIGQAALLQEAIARAAADYAERELETIRKLFEPTLDETFWLSEIHELLRKIEVTGSAFAKERVNDERGGVRKKVAELEFALDFFRCDLERSVDPTLTPELVSRLADLDKSRLSIDRELRILNAYGDLET
jgi:hypothetical protein